eukprot:360476-Chlamydomonas_euryale.AAC.7
MTFKTRNATANTRVSSGSQSTKKGGVRCALSSFASSMLMNTNISIRASDGGGGSRSRRLLCSFHGSPRGRPPRHAPQTPEQQPGVAALNEMLQSIVGDGVSPKVIRTVACRGRGRVRRAESARAAPRCARRRLGVRRPAHRAGAARRPRSRRR